MKLSLRWQSLFKLLVIVTVSIAVDQSAFAQYARVPQAPQSQSGGSRQRNTQSRRNSPTVSPYLSLINTDGNNNVNGSNSLNFFNIVRPQRRAQRVASQLGRELHTVEGNLSSLQKTTTSQNQSRQVSPAESSFAGRMEPTGHETAFGELQGFYADYGSPR